MRERYAGPPWRGTVAVARREFRSAFCSLLAYAVIVVFLVVPAAWLFFVEDFAARNVASLRGYFGVMPLLLTVLASAVTMRSWAEERKLGTEELLLTLPLRESELVLGKYLASVALLVLMLLLTLPLPWSLLPLGDFERGEIAAQYLGVLAVGCAALAVGQFVSSWCRSQVSAFLLSLAVLLGLMLVDRVGGALGLTGVGARVLLWLSMNTHYQSFTRGVVDTRGLSYFLVLSVALLYATSRRLAMRRWV